MSIYYLVYKITWYNEINISLIIYHISYHTINHIIISYTSHSHIKQYDIISERKTLGIK